MTIKAVIENLWKMKKFYQMNTEEENEVIISAVGYLENLDAFTEKINGLSEEWVLKKGGRTMKKAIQPNEYEEWNKYDKETKEEEVIQAANVIKEYCKSIPVTCDGCIFRNKELINYGCKLNNPNHLPETWEIGEKKE